ncbi:MAG: hypothetical protein WD894_01405 [Pirellulales bacterium]
MAAAWVSAAILAAHVAMGQEAKPAAQEQDETQESANKRQLAVMRTLADTIQVTVGDGEQGKEAKLIPKPLFRFSDPSRLYSDGSVWAWATPGRPLAMVEFRTEDRNGGVWGHDLVATSDVRVSAEVAGHGRWAPQEPVFKLQPVSDSAPPAKTEAARLRQMKRFARTLSASEVRRGQRYELRLLPTEIHRYSDAQSGLVDGAAFAFVVGSNPEVILFVEAHKADSGELSWKYGLARMTAAEMTFLLGDTEVWTVPGFYGGLSESYYCFTRSVPDAVDGPD